MKTALPEPGVALHKLRLAAKPHHIMAFFSALLSGLVTHLYFFTNYLHNSETVAFIYRDMDLTGQGRWFTHWARLLSGAAMSPWVKGFLCLLYLSFTAVIITSLFRLRQPLAIILCSCFSTCFPAIGATFTYLYLADGFIFGLLLSAISVLLADRWKWSFIPGAFLLAASVGTYQTYLSFAMLLVLLLAIQKAFLPKTKAKPFGLWLLRQAIMIAAGFLLYLAILQIALAAQGIGLSNNQNIGLLTQGFAAMLATVANNFGQTYPQFFQSLIRLPGFFTTARLLPAGVLFSLTGLVLLAIVIRQRLWRQPWRLVCVVVAVLLIPPAACFILLAQPDNFHLLMQQPFSLLFMAPCLLLDKILAGKWPTVLAKWACVLLSIVLLWQFYITTNNAYTNMQLRMDRTYSLTLRMADRIEQTDGYAPHLPVVIVGFFDESVYPYHASIDPSINGFTGAEGNLLYAGEYYLLQLLQQHHNLHNPGLNRYGNKAEEREALVAGEQVQAMPCFPAAGCVQVIDGVIVVKLSPNDDFV